MRAQDAQEIIRMVEANGRFDLGEARSLWRTALAPFDAEIATNALLRLAKTRRRIDLSDLVELITAMTPKPERIEENTRKIVGPPEYVYVFWWARLRRNPPEQRDFPQIHYQSPTAISVGEYEALRKEWIEVGSPTDVFGMPQLEKV